MSVRSLVVVVDGGVWELGATGLNSMSTPLRSAARMDRLLVRLVPTPMVPIMRTVQ
jgi:hypothetical protein